MTPLRGADGRWGDAFAGVVGRLGGARWTSWLKRATWLRPRLFDLVEKSELATLEPGRLLRDVLGVQDLPARDLLREARTVTDALGERSRSTPLRFPPEWAASPATGELLYVLVRSQAPEVILETGVANGVSSTYLLEALERNGKGRLESFDLDPDAGVLIREALRSRWTLHVLGKGAPGADLERILRALPAPDLAFVDADHSYPGQRLEYRLVSERLRPGGWLVSDDVDWSYAFLDHCAEQGVRPSFLVTESKVVGLLRTKP